MNNMLQKSACPQGRARIASVAMVAGCVVGWLVGWLVMMMKKILIY
jgi:F0F1-type ATP synthase assembly protein I